VSALVSRVLLAFAIEFERESELSLAISSNVVRLRDEKGVRFRELPRLSGVSKELIQVAVGWLEKRQARFGLDAIRNLRQSLEHLVGTPTARLSPLFRGLEPHPGGWRASVPRPEGLPHYPMVTHRGGSPDGS